MVRTVLAWWLVALLAVTAGCTMCAHPYDYCGSTYTGEGGPPCNANVRRGSIFSDGAVTAAVFKASDETTQPAAEPAVESTDEVEPPDDPAYSGQARRWTARRPRDVPQP